MKLEYQTTLGLQKCMNIWVNVFVMHACFCITRFEMKTIAENFYKAPSQCTVCNRLPPCQHCSEHVFGCFPLVVQCIYHPPEGQACSKCSSEACWNLIMYVVSAAKACCHSLFLFSPLVNDMVKQNFHKSTIHKRLHGSLCSFHLGQGSGLDRQTRAFVIRCVCISLANYWSLASICVTASRMNVKQASMMVYNYSARNDWK